MDRLLRKKSTVWFLVLPGLFVMAFGVVAPILMSVYQSFTDSGMGVSSSFIGLANYQELFQDAVFWESLGHAGIMALAYMFILNPFAIFMAILLDQIGGKAEKWFRILFFVPCMLSLMVTTKMWMNLLNPTFGFVNKLLGAIGLTQLQRNWLTDPNLALGCLILIAMWQLFGWVMLVYYAGVKGVPTELYEASLLDGCNGLKKHIYVTLPSISPVIKVNMTLSLINALKEMETIYLITNGGPGSKTEFVATYLYKQAFTAFRYGYANTISVVFVILCLAAALLYQKIANSGTEGD